jgi:hypothetical protein
MCFGGERCQGEKGVRYLFFLLFLPEKVPDTFLVP